MISPRGGICYPGKYAIPTRRRMHGIPSGMACKAGDGQPVGIRTPLMQPQGWKRQKPGGGREKAFELA